MEIKSFNVNRILPLILGSLLLMLSSSDIELGIFERKILTCCGQNRLITELWPWKNVQKSSSSCSSFISYPKQLLFKVPCCYCYCKGNCFKAHLLPGKKSANKNLDIGSTFSFDIIDIFHDIFQPTWNEFFILTIFFACSLYSYQIPMSETNKNFF